MKRSLPAIQADISVSIATDPSTAITSDAVFVVNMSDRPHITETHRWAVGTAIRELLDTRNFLALQLTEATGGITAEQFRVLADAYYRVPRSLAEAQERVASLLEVGVLDVDEEELSVVLGCTLVDATTIVDEMGLWE